MDSLEDLQVRIFNRLVRKVRDLASSYVKHVRSFNGTKYTRGIGIVNYFLNK